LDTPSYDSEMEFRQQQSCR